MQWAKMDVPLDHGGMGGEGGAAGGKGENNFCVSVYFFSWSISGIFFLFPMLLFITFQRGR